MFGRVAAFCRLQAFKWREKLFWFQSRPPHIEFTTFLVEGKKGEGKTRYLTGWACRQMRRGVRIASNYTICDRLSGKTSIPVGGWIDVLRISVESLREGIPTVFVIDEFHLWADSRNYAKLPDFFKGWLAQSRHYGVGLCGSVQNFKTVDLRVRQITDELRRIRKVKLFNVPLYRTEIVAPESVDAEGDYALSEPHFGLFKWYAGYDTRELIQVEEYRTDEEQEAEIAALCEEAAALVRPGEFATFAAAEEARRADRAAGSRFDEEADPNLWEDAATYALPTE